MKQIKRQCVPCTSGQIRVGSTGFFATRCAVHDLPIAFAPDFDKGGGLIAAVAQDADSGEVLMLAWMDREAFEKTLSTGEAHYHSRSRKKLWHKGATSGHVQRVHSLRLDCDGDAVLLRITQVGGAACHEGYRSCFYREWKDGEVHFCAPKVFNPEEIYR